MKRAIYDYRATDYSGKSIKIDGVWREISQIGNVTKDMVAAAFDSVEKTLYAYGINNSGDVAENVVSDVIEALGLEVEE